MNLSEFVVLHVAPKKNIGMHVTVFLLIFGNFVFIILLNIFLPNIAIKVSEQLFQFDAVICVPFLFADQISYDCFLIHFRQAKVPMSQFGETCDLQPLETHEGKKQ